MEMEIVFPGGARVDALMGPHTVVTNQDGSAPTPFAHFLASIGTCAGIYVLGFCQHRNLPTEGIKIVQRIVTDPATRMVDTVQLDIVVPPSFPEKYHEALIRAAHQCAVKKHLENPPEFEVRTRVQA
ncbi:MAG: osmotically inducible protein OsmC [Gemmatimonadetes bacterium]|nr:osmotically inducible protein OsmC [Gemmatimonadota bacterium]